MEKKSGNGFVLFAIGLIFTFLVLIGTGISIIQYGRIDEKRPCDVAIVLGAGTYNGEISAVYRERINHGIWLWENGYADYLIFTGGYGEGSNMADSAAARAYALSQGVPGEYIYIEEASTITEENFSESKKLMDEYGWQTALVVSDPLHMKRAMLMAKDYGVEGYSSPTPTTMYRSLKTKIPFLIREEFYYIGYSVIRLFV